MFGKSDKKKRPFFSPAQGDVPPEYTLAEKREMQFEYRHWHCKPMHDMQSPYEVHDWAMAMIRPGESRGDYFQTTSDNHQQLGECNYIARCVTIAESMDAQSAWRAFASKEQRNKAQMLAEQMQAMSCSLLNMVAAYDAMEKHDIGPDDDD